MANSKSRNTQNGTRDSEGGNRDSGGGQEDNKSQGSKAGQQDAGKQENPSRNAGGRNDDTMGNESGSKSANDIGRGEQQSAGRSGTEVENDDIDQQGGAGSRTRTTDASGNEREVRFAGNSDENRPARTGSGSNEPGKPKDDRGNASGRGNTGGKNGNR